MDSCYHVGNFLSSMRGNLLAKNQEVQVDLDLVRMGKPACPLAVLLFFVRRASLARLRRCWSRTSSAPGIVSASGALLAAAAARPSHRGYGPGCSSHRTAVWGPSWWPYGHHSHSEIFVGASTREGRIGLGRYYSLNKVHLTLLAT